MDPGNRFFLDITTEQLGWVIGFYTLKKSDFSSVLVKIGPSITDIFYGWEWRFTIFQAYFSAFSSIYPSAMNELAFTFHTCGDGRKHICQFLATTPYIINASETLGRVGSWTIYLTGLSLRRPGYIYCMF